MITCYPPFCPTPDTGPAEAACPGLQGLRYTAKDMQTFKCCLLFHMTLQVNRTKGTETPAVMNCFYTPQQKYLETITFSN